MLPAAPSDAPRREPGTRARSGNAMHRTRAALLDAAEHCVERYGARRTTMGDVALKAAVAKGTLYNHFRTKDDLLAALAQTRALELVERARGQQLDVALAAAAQEVSSSAVVRRVAAEEPALAAALLTSGAGRAWQAVRDAVRGLLGEAGADDSEASVALVLRWVGSHVLSPADPQQCSDAAARLAVALVPPS